MSKRIVVEQKDRWPSNTVSPVLIWIITIKQSDFWNIHCHQWCFCHWIRLWLQRQICLNPKVINGGRWQQTRFKLNYLVGMLFFVVKVSNHVNQKAIMHYIPHSWWWILHLWHIRFLAISNVFEPAGTIETRTSSKKFNPTSYINISPSKNWSCLTILF